MRHKDFIISNTDGLERLEKMQEFSFSLYIPTLLVSSSSPTFFEFGM